MSRNTPLFAIGHQPELSAANMPLPTFQCYAEVSNRHLWDTNALPYVFSGVTYLPVLELIMKKSNRFKSNIEFVTLKLNSQDKAKFDDWVKAEGKKIFKFLADFSEGGYKLSISPDFNNACIIASVTGTDNSAENNGLCMTSRAETIEEALLIACYKHFVMADGGDWLTVAGKNEDNWG